MPQGTQNPDGMYLRPRSIGELGWPTALIPHIGNHVQHAARFNFLIDALNIIRNCTPSVLAVPQGTQITGGVYLRPKTVLEVDWPDVALPHFPTNVQHASRWNFLIDALNALRACAYSLPDTPEQGRSNLDGSYLIPKTVAFYGYPCDPLPYFDNGVQQATLFNLIIDALNDASRCCPDCSCVNVPSPDFEMKLCDVTTLADVMAMSYDMNDDTPWALAGMGNYTPVLVAGKRMVNAAGLTLVADTTSANGVCYLRLGSAPNVGEAGYGWQNSCALFPADQYPNFCCRFIVRKMEGGACFEGSVALLTPNYFQGLAFWRDGISGEIRLISYMTQLTGDFTSPLTGQTFFNDLIQIDMRWMLSNPTNINVWDVRYNASVDITVRANGVVKGRRSVTGQVTASRYPVGGTSWGTTTPSANPAPWQLVFETQVFGDNVEEVHGWGFKV